MKYTVICIFAVFYISSSNAQKNSAFNYFSFTIGLTHGIFNIHEQGETSKSFYNGTTYYQLIKEDNSSFNYRSGFNAGLFFNHDFRNDDMGISLGIQYQNHPYKVNYTAAYIEEKVTEKTNIHTLVIPFYFKYGKRFYDPMRYIYFGAQANYHFGGTQNYEYPEGTTNYILEKDYINKFTPSIFIGFNYHIFNIKLEYLHSAILNDSPLEIENLADNSGHAEHFIFINTDIHIPATSWIIKKLNIRSNFIKRLFR